RGRVEGQARIPLMGDEARAASRSLPARADLYERPRPQPPTRRDDHQARAANGVLRAEHENEPAAVTGTGLQRALQVAAPENTARARVDGADEGVAEPAAAGADDRGQHPRPAGPRRGVHEPVDARLDEINVAEHAQALQV